MKKRTGWQASKNSSEHLRSVKHIAKDFGWGGNSNTLPRKLPSVTVSVQKSGDPPRFSRLLLHILERYWKYKM